jgi:hypothetical protein
MKDMLRKVKENGKVGKLVYFGKNYEKNKRKEKMDVEFNRGDGMNEIKEGKEISWKEEKE